MPFKTILHPTDFDEPSREAFRVARALAQAVGARVFVHHIVPPPAVLTQDGRVFLDPKSAEPTDLWPEYRTLAAETPTVPVQYDVVVGKQGEAIRMLEQKIRELGEGVLVVMGSHGRTGLPRLLWGSLAEKVVREAACPVLVVKAPGRAAASSTARHQATAKPEPAAEPGRRPHPPEVPANQGPGKKVPRGVHHE
jgi:nucleotide-binding universal stress UspA family protein